MSDFVGYLISPFLCICLPLLAVNIRYRLMRRRWAKDAEARERCTIRRQQP